ncbi:MAG: magnesium and cobalt transport protein CorA [Nitrospinae bacterium CG11_big_fil_rev_8_21_14_0_20_45_15]|nr:MAG: magnesium and cobalt transport protein CorA [Nitrospinae bacterium CG11_big_fil_rev_8_21_14_0_20_45_15]
MVRVMHYDPASDKTGFGDQSLIDQWKSEEASLIWVDISGMNHDEECNLLTKCFDINSLAIADAQRDRHPPKIEFFDNYFFLLLKGLDANTSTIDFTTIQIALFIGKRFLVTRRASESVSLDKGWKEVQNGSLKLSQGLNHIAYRVSRLITDRYTPIVLDLEKQLEQLEESMFNDPNDDLLEQLVSNNRNLKKLRRILTYQKGLFDELAKRKESHLSDNDQHEYTDIFEHLDRLASLSSLYQELTLDLLNGYISLSSHKLNKIIKVLTIVTVVLLPLTLIAGIYGMNFESMPELKTPNGYHIVLEIMGFIVLGLIIFFRKIKWL